MENHQQKDAHVIVIPYSCKNDIKLVKEVGLELIDQIIAEEFKNLKVSPEIMRNYKKRLQIFHANLIRNIKDHVCLSKSTDCEAKKEVTEYSERDETLGFENDKILSDLHNIIEKNRNTKQLIMEKIRSKVKQDFERCRQQAQSENQNLDTFDIICIEGENCSRSINKEKFLKSFQENYTNKLKHNLDCHKLSYDNFESIYNNRKHMFFEVSQSQNELLTMLSSVNFDLSEGEKALFG